MKKIVSLVLIFTLLCSMPFTAFAVERTETIDQVQLSRLDVEPYAVDVAESENEVSFQSAFLENFDDSIFPNSTDKPKKYWDLSGSNNYYADLQVVGIAWLYTNYYFKPSSDAKIRVRYTVYSDTHRATQMQIGLYDHDLKKIVCTWTTAGAGGEGTSNTIDFYNLNKSHYYSIAFTSVFDGFTHDTLHGSATISHPKK